MKKFVLPLIILCLSGILLSAQEVFPTSDAIWNVNTEGDQSFLYGLTGDTLLINDTIYHKLYFLTDTTLSEKSRKNCIGAIRQEDRKVWLRVQDNRDKDIEVLLYDFSKNIGEKIVFTPLYTHYYNLSYFFYSPDEQIEGYVDTITEDSLGRKHYFIRYPDNPEYQNKTEEWIEGIGTTSGVSSIYVSWPTCIDCTGYYRSFTLQCFKHNGKTEYQHNQEWSSCKSCFCPGQHYVDIIEEKTGNIKLFPNPENREIRIEIPSGISHIQVNIYNLSGALLLSRPLTDTYTSLNTRSFLPGTYIYRINQLGKPLQSGKIIIQ